ncbi:DnaD domain protein [Oceanobacillus piezotolerans]|uniref:DnaD domain protein n=1 Tax=Oceanobacillus piezotolerans TaxID=2448030 RepID=A0A498DJ02_9BACI|nr:DnaD domain protein [Oceanobacillus piezotolerans]RLL45485.1 DnaD domain protein [Oceanobacillus piezotolerans]
MNYIKELNAFRSWKMFNDLPTGAVALWYSLMAVNNQVGWKKRFNVPNPTLQMLTGLSKQGLDYARKRLIEGYYIKYESGKRGQAPVYQMNSMTEKMKGDGDLVAGQTVYQSPYPSNPSLESPSHNNSLPIPKKKQVSSSRHTPDAYTVYEQNIGILKPIARESFQSWCDDLGDEMVIYAIELAVKLDGRTFSYVESILKEWASNHFETLEQVKTFERQKSERKRKTVAFPKKEKEKKGLFQELREEAKHND